MTNEQLLAGTILIDAEALSRIKGHVSAEDFQSEHCRSIFESAVAISSEGGIVDPITIKERSARNGVVLSNDYLAQLMEITPTVEFCVAYADRVAEDSRKRRIKELAAQIQEDSISTPDELLEKIQKEVTQIAEKHGPSKSAKGFDSISAQDLQNADLAPVQFLVDDILPEGTSLFSAASKIGKSWMALDMGMCIAAGWPFMGHKTHKAGVLYLALEDSRSRLKGRLNAILSGCKAPAGFQFVTVAPTLDNGLLDTLDVHLQKFPDTKLVIIDTLQKIRGRALPREGAYEQDYREMGTVKSYMDKRGLSVLFIHHNRKMKDEDDPFNMISGTNALMGAADTIWTIIKGKRVDGEATLHITGRDVMQAATIISFDKSCSRWKPIGEADQITVQREKFLYESNPIVKTIRELLKQHREWKGTASDLMAEGKKICKRPISPTAQKLGRDLNSLDDQLLSFDGIVHQKTGNGNAGNKHYFFFNSWTDEAEQQEMEPL